MIQNLLYKKSFCNQYLQYFEKAIQLCEKQNYETAIGYFESGIQDAIQQNDKKLLFPMMKKYALTLKILQNDQKLLPTLEEIYFLNYDQQNYNYYAYDILVGNLLTEYCLNDIGRGLAFTQTLLKEHEINPIPLKYFNYLSIYFGNIFYLNQNKEKSLYFYDQALDSSNVETRAIALANITMLKIENNDGQEIEPSIIKALKKSMNLLEFEDKTRQNDRITETEYMGLKVALNQNFEAQSIQPHNLKLMSNYSLKIAQILTQYFLDRNVLDKAAYWAQMTINSAIQKKQMHKFSKSLIQMADIMELQNNLNFSETLFLNFLDLDHNQVSHKNYHKVEGLARYSQFLRNQNRIYEANDVYQQSLILNQNYNQSQKRLQNIVLPEFEFKF